ncbi:hypothetical protein HZQ19_02185 [Elizabethkingia anophelis]|uniref:hypothetical protein n=1 Tax=Elizabethkingia anophelis TaxID=1117645 RepID=UPI0015E13905|nr:hypothetical protein [Elizabethkingia anophelis]MCT3758494.1 hypothetical protein [Elizabethkingia anophelis]MCT3971858.1 hypothetical protein [Elizabethkingia anophelis]MCT4000323.1 hypothetical protein [Elizabethkingia anophelis]MCT4014696.1 hypothetical protein [Elizabethkingia anophelis]MCT4018257.1 hypothetical protein [Elizabethkingia anophelis]
MVIKEIASLSALYYWKTRKIGTTGSLMAARRIMAGIKTGTAEGYSTVLNYYNKLKAA